MKSARILSLALMVVVAGCDSKFQQSVEIKVTGYDGAPVVGADLRYHSEGACKGTFVAAATSVEGVARFQRTAMRGGIGVLLEEPSLCFSRQGNWYAAWQEFIDPAVREAFTCKAREDGAVSCERESQGGA